MNKDRFVDLVRAGSGCALASTLPFMAFKQLCEMTSDVCDGCGFKPCDKMKQDERRAKDARRAHFGMRDFETNAEKAKRLGISKRQAAKLKKRIERT